MNVASIVGRLTRDPDARATQGGTFVTRYTVAVDRRFKREGEPTTDFINCVSFGQQAEFAEKYFVKGMRVAVTGRIQTGSYTNKDGQKVNTFDIVVDHHESADSRGEKKEPKADGFVSVPEDGELPWN